jgi:hypothetical protein
VKCSRPTSWRKCGQNGLKTSCLTELHCGKFADRHVGITDKIIRYKVGMGTNGMMRKVKFSWRLSFKSSLQCYDAV